MPLRGVNGRLRCFALSLLPRYREDAEDTAPAIKKLVIPAGLAISCIAHLALLIPVVIFAGANPFDTAPVEAITVDIVSPDDLQEGPKPESSPASTTPPLDTGTFDTTIAVAPSPAASAPSAQPPPEPQPQSPQAAPSAQQGQSAARTEPTEPARPSPAWLPQPFAPAEPEPPQPAPPQESDVTNMFAMPLTLPDGRVGGRFDSQAVDRADIANDAVAAFRSHLKTCSILPAGVAADVRVVLRIYLKPDGSLAAGLPQNPEPIKVEGVSRGGGVLFQNAVAAVRKCQPYKMLPPDRYQEWKTLDLTLTPQTF